MFKKGFVKEIWQIYAHYFFSSLFFGGSIILLYYKLHGLTLAQIGLMTTIVYTTNFLLEYPTGIIADKYGRKLSLQLALVFWMLQSLSLILVPNLYTIAVSSFFVGVAFSFQSGADQAILYDSLKSLKKEKLNKFALGICDSIYGIGMIIAALTGPLLYQMNPRFPFILTVLLTLIGLIIFSTFKEPKYYHSKKELNSIKAFREGIRLIFKNKSLFFIFLLPLFMFFYEHAWTETGQILLTDAGFPVLFLGFFYAIRSILLIAGGGILPRLVHKIKSSQAIILVIAIQAVGLFFLSNNNAYLMAFFSYFLFLSHVFWSYVESDIVHKHIPSRIRATTMSAKQMMGSLVFIINPWLMAYLVQTFSKSIFVAFSIIMILSSTTIFYIGRKHLR